MRRSWTPKCLALAYLTCQFLRQSGRVIRIIIEYSHGSLLLSDTGIKHRVQAVRNKVAADDQNRGKNNGALQAGARLCPDIASTQSLPMPGKLNIVSVITAPDSREAICMAMTVMTGIMAFRRCVEHYRTWIRLCPSP